MVVGHTHGIPVLFVRALLLLTLLLQTACAARQSPALLPTEASPQAASGEPPLGTTAPTREERITTRLPEDKENTLPNRILAAPESAWMGLVYPFKKFVIAYERYDLLNRALDLFLNDERTAGVYPRFSLGGTLSSGIGLTAFNNNLFRRGKEARRSCSSSSLVSLVWFSRVKRPGCITPCISGSAAMAC